MKQYSKRMVIVHWLTLILMVVAYLIGDELDEARHEHDAQLAAYLAHALAGGTVLLFTALRLTFRSADGVPLPVGDTLMDKAAKGVHYLLYVLLFLLPFSGIMTTLTSGVGNALLSGDASQLPSKYTGASSMPHTVHEILVKVVIVLVILHVLGAIKHQFITKDGLMKRMSLRRKD